MQTAFAQPLNRWRAWLCLALLAFAAGPLRAAWVASPWAPDAGDVYTMALHPSGILIGGSAFNGNGIQGQGVVRLNAGTLAQDMGFAPVVSWGSSAGEVHAIAVQSDGKVLIGGRFDQVNGVPRSNIARLNADGTLDGAYMSTVSGNVTALVIQPDDQLLVGGSFSQVNGSARSHLARLTPIGVLDAGFSDALLDNSVRALALQPDGKVLVGGFMNTAHGQPRAGLARLNSDGSLDASFANPSIADWVNAMFVQPDGKVLVGGSLGTVGGVARVGLARLNADGTLDPGFTVDTDGSVYGLAPSSGSRVVLVGGFEHVAGTPLQRVARVDYAQAALDPTLTNVGVTHAGFITYTALARSPSDVLIGGWFARVDQQYRSSLAQIIDLPGVPLAPVITQTRGFDGAARITVSPPADTGSSSITGYSVTCTPMGPGTAATAIGSSPVAVPGLTNDTPHECVARAINTAGAGPASAPAEVTPTAAGGPLPLPEVTPVPALSLWALLLLGLACTAAACRVQRSVRA